MERLTEKHYGTDGYFMKCSEVCANDDEMCGGCPSQEKIIDRLGAYEDTGLTPERVAALKEGKPIEAFLHPIDAYEGLKEKYLVFKADTGEKVRNCFVLRPDKDAAAIEALRAYAKATDNENLAGDIYIWVGEDTADALQENAEKLRNSYTVQEIEALQNEAYDLGVDSALHHKFGLSWDDAAELRKEIQRLQDSKLVEIDQFKRWIPVSERLPEECGFYICFFQSPYGNDCWRVGQCHWNEESWVRIGVVPPHVKVTHWMPLPEPPKGEQV